MASEILQGYRALDLTDGKGFFCGKILADLGVDTIKIEPPGGDPCRNKPPFYHGLSDPEKSLYWFAYNANKRGITLDLETTEGKDLFRNLVEGTDFVLESFPPGYMASLGLDYPHLALINPGLIMTSITDFGQTGPYSNYKGSDLVVQALGLMLSQMGDADRAPVRITLPQVYMHACVEAAEAAMIAHHHRGLTGEGQHVDVSAMESAIWSTNWSLPTWDASKTEVKRLGTSTAFAGRESPQLWECKNGWVVFTLQAGIIGARSNPKLTEWMASEGMAPSFMKEKDWAAWDWMKSSRAEIDSIIDAIGKFFLTHMKEEIEEQGRKRDIIVYPVSTIADILNNMQLQERQFWTQIHHDELQDTLDYPGAFAEFSKTPIHTWRRAPLIGEDNHEILGSLSVHSADNRSARQGNGTPGHKSAWETGVGALNGLKVVAFVTEGVGPLLTKSLATNGATVVLVESTKRPDGTRLRSPFKDNEPGMERSYRFAAANSDKYDITINLKHPRAREVTRRLIQSADAIIENFRPGVMEGFGLSYEAVRAINPSIVMMSLTSQGQTGPYRSMAGYGPHLAGYSGFTALAGWPDRWPVTVGPYTDMIAPHFGVVALLAALDYRRRTGEGQYIDLSQLEASLHFLSPAVLGYIANGMIQTRNGNKSPYAAPHGVYRCRGDDNWCAVAVFTDPEWKSFCGVIGNPQWTEREEFASLPARKENEAELDHLVEQWTLEHTAEEVMELLQRGRVAAGVVRNAGEIIENCPQLKHRHFFWKLEHPEIGVMNVFGSGYKLSRTPYRIARPAPRLGEHTEYVCTRFLKMRDDEFLTLFAEGVFT
ncbi:MAG TPA: CoA transferase [Syntrophorhabdaceae bacterium]|nr:CoA transferase [Syntrophorhabdaceae bacterium]